MVASIGERVRVGFALLIVRSVIGAAFLLRGWMKLQHPFTWNAHGPLHIAPWLQAFVSVLEFAGGGALILGLLTRLVAILLIGDMTVVVFGVFLPHGGVFIGSDRSFEVPLDYLIAMIAFLAAGAGCYSLDALLARTVLPRTLKRRLG